MKLKEFLSKQTVILDGGMGTLLQARGLKPGEPTESRNLTHPDEIIDAHKQYFDAGANIVASNTFGVNALKYNDDELKKLIQAAISHVKKASALSKATQEKFVAFDVGSLGKLIKPLGELEFETAVAAFSKSMRLAEENGADLIFIETFNDLYETKAALLAAKESTSLPVFVSCAYANDGKLMTGATPETVVAVLEGLGADAIGVNCSFGPKQLLPVVQKYLSCASVPVLFKPNAGLPTVKNGNTEFDITPEEFAQIVLSCVDMGVGLIGGCCGTTPEYIRLLSQGVAAHRFTPPVKKSVSVVASGTQTEIIGKKPLLIGERINPTGKKAFREAIMNGDINYVLEQGISQQEAGAHILDVNVGVPGINEADVLQNTVNELQWVTDLPLQIDTSDAKALEKALRIVNGKPLINSVNGKKESMEAVFPLAKKYGGVVVALTLDENGIPETAEGRFAIAQKITNTAKCYGIEPENLIFDPLVMAVSADKNAARVTLDALIMIRERLNAHTVLGVSNISHGLPLRDKLNGAFFMSALTVGLSAAIINPLSGQIMNTYISYCALNGYDENFERYIQTSDVSELTPVCKATAEVTDIKTAVMKGMKERCAALTAQKLKTVQGLDIIKEDLIPALDEIGVAYEEKRAYLPQLLMAAETAKAAFEVIKAHNTLSVTQTKCQTVIATVQGDVHDIGKNIVRLLLSNYGFAVTDLGKDVAPEQILDTVLQLHAPILGLSALMTTTVPAMQKTVELIHQNAPFCKVIVGGAVLTPEYAKEIHADFYAKDAMETVRIAECINQ